MNICVTAPGQSGGTNITDPSIRNRLLEAGKQLFADKGYAGASVREICTMADASVPMIKHYFGNKEGLYRAILGQFSSDTFDMPIRLIANPPKSRDEFLTKLELFISETFRALLIQAPVLRILSREGSEFVDLGPFKDALAEFLKVAQAKGFIRDALNIDMVTGLVLDRLTNQVLFSVNPNYKGPNVLSDKNYRDDWLRANIDVLINGLAGS